MYKPEYDKKSHGAKFTYGGGREIFRDGKVFIGVTRLGDTSPVEADEAAALVADLLDRFYRRRR